MGLHILSISPMVSTQKYKKEKINNEFNENTQLRKRDKKEKGKKITN